MTDLSISRITVDFIILAICAIPLIIFQKWVQPYKRGFYCDDESIRYPYRPSTVSRQMLVIIGLVVPALLIILTETFRAIAWERKCREEFQYYRYRRYSVPRIVVRLYVFFGYFLVGVVFNQLMVDIAKYTIGRQRPHFLAVCKPKGIDKCPIDSHEYITNFECTGTDQYLLRESVLSFYSGHAAFSFYAAWYTVLYLQARLYRPLFSRLLLPAVQFALFAGAAFVAYTRVSNYKHHWSDVLVGALIGSVIGITVAVFVAKVFSRREIPPCHAHYFNRQFGLAPRMEHTIPLADVEAGMSNIVRTDRSGIGAQGVTPHNITVTGVMAPNVNEVRNSQLAPFPRPTSRNQRL